MAQDLNGSQSKINIIILLLLYYSLYSYSIKKSKIQSCISAKCRKGPRIHSLRDIFLEFSLASKEV